MKPVCVYLYIQYMDIQYAAAVVCMYVCMHACMYVFMYAFIHCIRVLMYYHVCIFLCMYSIYGKKC